MVRLLHNLGINTAALAAIVAWMLLFGSITALVIAETRTAQNSMNYLSELSVEQLNQVSSAETVLNRARLNLEAAYSYLASDRTLQAERRLEDAQSMLTESEQTFERFMAVPKNGEADELAQQLLADYEEVLALV